MGVLRFEVGLVGIRDGRVFCTKNAAADDETLARGPVTRLREPQGPRAGPAALGAEGLPPRGNDTGYERDASLPLQRGARVRPLQGAGARVPGRRGVLVFFAHHSYSLAEDNRPSNSIDNPWLNIKVKPGPVTAGS